jgi:hypothetical protein
MLREIPGKVREAGLLARNLCGRDHDPSAQQRVGYGTRLCESSRVPRGREHQRGADGDASDHHSSSNPLQHTWVHPTISAFRQHRTENRCDLINIQMSIPDSNLHSFDENLRLQSLWDGIEQAAALMLMVGRQ